MQAPPPFHIISDFHTKNIMQAFAVSHSVPITYLRVASSFVPNFYHPPIHLLPPKPKHIPNISLSSLNPLHSSQISFHIPCHTASSLLRPAVSHISPHAPVSIPCLDSEHHLHLSLLSVHSRPSNTTQRDSACHYFNPTCLLYTRNPHT